MLRAIIFVIPVLFFNAVLTTRAAEPTDDETQFISNARQLIFEGRRSGEGYYNDAGTQIVFQSERQADNPFYQIYRLDLTSGDLDRISSGIGKTTCAWFHPDNKRILYASTQFDPEAVKKQQDKLAELASGKKSRYSWDYDPQYELVYYNPDGTYTRLTDTLGYDAECSMSPDGSLIIFASNRRAYSGELTADEQKLFEVDPASAMDLYLMNADGTGVRRLTDAVGYDGGAFFSPDGQRICWRRFDENGAVAEIFTCDLEGGDVRQLTTLGATSWAPYYHPSGDYLIFTSNLEGFSNFELYLVDAEGRQPARRVSFTDGFDGLPVFHPDGDKLLWASARTASGASQLFLADWNDEAARRLLELPPKSANAASQAAAGSQRNQEKVTSEADAPGEIDPQLQETAVAQAREARQAAGGEFSAADVGRHINFLCRPETGGRLTGTPGEKAAVAYVASYMQDLGLKPIDDWQDTAGVPDVVSGYVQPFEFTSGIRLSERNRLLVDGQPVDAKQWVPLALSSNGQIDQASVVFAGYGIVAPKAADASIDAADAAEYDSYVHLDVAGKWVLVFRNLPMDVSPARRTYLARFASLRYKAMLARERGAAGIIVVSGPTSMARQQLVPLASDGSVSGSQIAGVSVTDEVVQPWFEAAGRSLAEVQQQLDGGEASMGFDLPVNVSATIDVVPILATGWNAVGLLPADDPNATTIIVGAHIDHLGRGKATNSLAREEEADEIHRGADDNASGVAAMLEMAEYLQSEVAAGQIQLKHNLLFAAWSGEELGLIGSDWFIEHLPQQLQPTHPHDRRIAAYINLDMVGRLREKLVLQGIGSSDVWRSEIERRNAVVGLPLTLQEDSYLPTDASTFYIAGIPILSAFTGQHSEYHTPRDVPELINFEGAAQTAKLLALIVRSLATTAEPPAYQKQEAPQMQMRAAMTAYLGTVPDYTGGDIQGVPLSDVKVNSPAAAAGLQGGDVVVELGGKKIANIYDYTFAIEALQIGKETTIAIERNGQRQELKITPASRQ